MVLMAVFDWIADFLRGRSQRVSVNGNYSCWMNVFSAIPEGGALSYILFIIFINDLPDAVQNFCALFADDTRVYGPVGNEENRMSHQEDLNNLLKWSNEWQLKFNATKCKVMHYGRGNRHHECFIKTGKSIRLQLRIHH